MNYQQAIAYLESLNTFGINLGLERIEKLLALMGHPEQKYKTVHVTGTNGKGSVTVTLASILNASGIKTGMYTSPHLSSYTERMVIDGKQVGEESFAEAIAYTQQCVEKIVANGVEHPTQFEVITAAAFYLFACEKVEYAVIEVGLGGLLDSTNVITPEVAVITNVTLEHTDRCGNTVQDIAKHKAGIIKPGIPVVTAAQGKALPIIWETAYDLKASLYLVERDFSAQSLHITREGQEISIFTKEQGDLGNFTIRLLGRHQVSNSAIAVMTALILGKKEQRITLAAIREGLTRVSWPARFEIVAREPLTVIDGAHNPAGAIVLRNTLDEVFTDKPITFVLGILRDKNITQMTRNLIRPCDIVVVVRPDSDRAADPEEVAQQITCCHVETAPSIAQGIEQARKRNPEVLCVAGSLYLAGAARDIICQWTKCH